MHPPPHTISGPARIRSPGCVLSQPCFFFCPICLSLSPVGLMILCLIEPVCNLITCALQVSLIIRVAEPPVPPLSPPAPPPGASALGEEQPLCPQHLCPSLYLPRGWGPTSCCQTSQVGPICSLPSPLTVLILQTLRNSQNPLFLSL